MKLPYEGPKFEYVKLAVEEKLALRVSNGDLDELGDHEGEDFEELFG